MLTLIIMFSLTILKHVLMRTNIFRIEKPIVAMLGFKSTSVRIESWRTSHPANMVIITCNNNKIMTRLV